MNIIILKTKKPLTDLKIRKFINNIVTKNSLNQYVTDLIINEIITRYGKYNVNWKSIRIKKNNLVLENSMFARIYNKILVLATLNNELTNANDSAESTKTRITLIVNKDKSFEFIDEDQGQRILSKLTLNELDSYVMRNLDTIKNNAKKRQQENIKKSKLLKINACNKAVEYISKYKKYAKAQDKINIEELQKYITITDKKQILFVKNRIENSNNAWLLYYTICAITIIYVILNTKRKVKKR